jgi:hypothetical protein
MTTEIPQYGLRAYALVFTRYGTNQAFKQSVLDWIVSPSMRKKIFSLLLNSGWIKKTSRYTYKCNEPKKIIKELLEFKVPEIIKKSEKPYAFTKLSAVEIWSDYSYIQRGIEKSPYFIKILKNDISYWKEFFNKNNIPNYLQKGSTIGEYIIIIPVNKINYTEKNGLKVEKLQKTIKIAKKNELYRYAYNYMVKKYAPT